jgi:hypothetical protein
MEATTVKALVTDPAGGAVKAWLAWEGTVYTLIIAADADAVQAIIGQPGDEDAGPVEVTLGWEAALKVVPEAGDGVVIALDGEIDKTAWLGEIEDVEGTGPWGEYGAGYGVLVTIAVK